MKALENTFAVSFWNQHTWHHNAPDLAQNLPDSRAYSSYWYIIEQYIFHLTDTFICIVTRLLSYKNLESKTSVYIHLTFWVAGYFCHLLAICRGVVWTLLSLDTRIAPGFLRPLICLLHSERFYLWSCDFGRNLWQTINAAYQQDKKREIPQVLF